MNDFQAILTVVVFFIVRFLVPATGIYGLARLHNHYFPPEESVAPIARTI